MMISQRSDSKLQKASPLRQRCGSVLLLTLLVVSLLLVLTLGFTVSVRLALREQTLHQNRRQAQLIAQLALNLAMDQLQKTAGPDQRSTASASLGDGATGVTFSSRGSNGLSATQNGTRYWTGVWGNLNSPESIFTESPEPILLSWLVSGNRAAFHSGSNGQITAPTFAPPFPFTPNMAVVEKGGLALSANTSAFTQLSLGAQPAALLLGPASAGDDPEAYIAAPLENLTQNTERVGRFAWWVGDEGVKAKFNLVDPYIDNETPDDGNSTDSRDSRYRVLVAQRNGIERMSAFNDSTYPTAATDASSDLYRGVDRTVSRTQIELAAAGVSAANLQAHVHDLTPYAQGVLADSQFGGLRQDLSFHLDARSGDTFLDGSNLIPDGSAPVSDFSGSKFNAKSSPFSRSVAQGGWGYTSLDVSPRLGPKWDQVKSFYQYAFDHPGDLEVQPTVDIDANPVKVQVGISPVILQARTMFALRKGPEIDTSLIVVLGNPYSRTLTAPEGLNLRVSLQPQGSGNGKHRGWEVSLVCDYQLPPPDADEFVYLFTRGDNVNPQFTTDLRSYPLLKYPDGPADPDVGHPGVLDQVLFQIPPGDLEIGPGQTKAYKISSGTLPSETIDGLTFTVVPLQEMTSAAPLTYYSHVCDSHYLSSDPRLPAGIFDGDPIPGDALFRYGLRVPPHFETGLNYTLTVPGKPHSVLQKMVTGKFWPSLSNDAAYKNRGVHVKYGPGTIFESGIDGEVMGGARIIRLFLDGSSAGAYFGESIRAIHAESNLLGTHQYLRTLSERSDSTAYKLLNVAPYGVYQSINFSESVMTQDLDPSSAEQQAWGYAHKDGNDFVLSDIPAVLSPEEVPVLSLAQLSHLDLTANDLALGVADQTGMGVGNSRYERYVPRELSRTIPMPNYWGITFSEQDDLSANAMGDIPEGYEGYVPDIPKLDNIRRYDISYLLNTALWDRNFFSTVRPASGVNTTLAPPPANQRLIYREGTPSLGQLRGSNSSEIIPDPAMLGPGENGRVPAAHLFIDGAFNVNSTSVEAWTAVLSGLRGLGVGQADADAGLTPFARSIHQLGAAQSELPSFNVAKRSDDSYLGFRVLTDDQVSALAVEMVKQVRARGPFLSLASFVNRNLTPAAMPGDPVADTSLSGAIQQAIDRTDINAVFNQGSALKQANDDRDQLYPDNEFMPEGTDSGLSTYMAAPGWLNQSDVLQALAPSLAARSDTFVIRTYGEMVDPNDASDSPRVLVRAWCEAVVQRVPDYLDDSDRPTMTSSQLNGLNLAFGRRFRIISFRWLTPYEI
ncbi:hypothetical protein P3T73_17515 [Kiritimatiellota bacterium B12222]|nr:hypothetical protein P3T73_17515 [Kiritimatiellota bacterium B12222]